MKLKNLCQRQNGMMMFDLFVKITVGRDDIIIAVAEHLSDIWPTRKKKIAPRKCLEILADQMRNHGYSFGIDTEQNIITQYGEEETQKIFALAQEIVKNNFPELF